MFARLPQLHARSDLTHAVQPHRDGLRVLLFDMGEPLLKRGGTDGRHADDSLDHGPDCNRLRVARGKGAHDTAAAGCGLGAYCVSACVGV
ncbi:hypothetical protein D3C81_1900140 [compost metagenome]